MKRTFFKSLSLFPALLLMIVIFFFSHQPAEDSSELSLGFSVEIIHFAEKVIGQELPPAEVLVYAEQIHVLIRKTAHFCEYFLLAVFLLFPLLINRRNASGNYLLSVFLSFLYACSDEIHQYFIPGRACMIKDILIDTGGAVLAMLILYLFFHKRSQQNTN